MPVTLLHQVFFIHQLLPLDIIQLFLHEARSHLHQLICPSIMNSSLDYSSLTECSSERLVLHELTLSQVLLLHLALKCPSFECFS